MINIYCDESCHLEHDDSDIMVLGGISCDKKNIKYISNKIDYLKSKYKIPKYEEIKWTKVSPSKLEFYIFLFHISAVVKHFFVPNCLAKGCCFLGIIYLSGI